MCKAQARCILGLLAIAAPTFAHAQGVSYEGTSFPEEAGWQRADRPFLPERWIEDGWFLQKTEVASFDPYIEEDDFYTRSIGNFAGVPRFFTEWRMQTDGNHDWFVDVAPAVVSAFGTMGVLHHFTITRDRFRLIDSYVDEYFFDMDAAVPHTYRLEVRDLQFAVFLDGQHIHAGSMPRSYPGPDSKIVFGARAPAETATTRWDYIRYGRMLEGPPGDMNCDGSINLFDIDPFVFALQSPVKYWQAIPDCEPSNADTNADGSVNQFDIVPFVSLLVR